MMSLVCPLMVSLVCPLMVSLVCPLMVSLSNHERSAWRPSDDA